MENKIKIPLSDELDIVAEKSRNEFNEIYIYLADKKGEPYQDIALVRGRENVNNVIQLLVWADENDEDYTHAFNIFTHEEDV